MARLMASLHAARGWAIAVLDGRLPDEYERTAALDSVEDTSTFRLVDFNLDGFDDLAVVSLSMPGVHVFLNDQRGGFPRQPSAVLGSSVATGVVGAEIDGDGRPDFVTFHPRTNQLTVLLSSSGYAEEIHHVGLRFSTGLAASALWPARQGVVLGTMDRPGLHLLRSNGASLELVQLTPRGRGEGAAPPPAPGRGRRPRLVKTYAPIFSEPLPGSTVVSIHPADVDGDGDADVVIRSWGTDPPRGQAVTLFVNGADRFTATRPVAIPSDSQSVSVHARLSSVQPASVTVLRLVGAPGAFELSFQQASLGSLGVGSFVAVPASMGFPAMLACIDPAEWVVGLFGCSAPPGTQYSKDPAIAAFVHKLCDILDLLDAFADHLKSNPATKKCGDDLEDIVDEVRQQKEQGDVGLGDLPGDVIGWTNPINRHIVFDIRFASVPCDVTSALFWQFINTVIHEGSHADSWTGETGATTATIALLEKMLKDWGDPNGFFQHRQIGTQTGTPPGTQPGQTPEDHIRSEKMDQKIYQLSVNEIFDELTQEYWEKFCQNDDDYDRLKAEYEQKYGVTLSVTYTPNPPDCGSRKLDADWVVDFCGNLFPVTVNYDER